MMSTIFVDSLYPTLIIAFLKPRREANDL